MPDDDKSTIAAKLRGWIDANIPNEPEPSKAEQALLAWNGIHAVWRRDPQGFAEAWGEHGPAAMSRQSKRLR
jgi:hypothetical protein